MKCTSTSSFWENFQQKIQAKLNKVLKQVIFWKYCDKIPRQLWEYFWMVLTKFKSDFEEINLSSPLAPLKGGDKHTPSGTFLDKIQCRTTFIWRFFACDAYFWQHWALNRTYFLPFLKMNSSLEQRPMLHFSKMGFLCRKMEF